ncbi:MAG TPA: TIM barrel protein [Gemmatimonadaceae bacterium]|nr:TIM barrel protein [Gemmatimonadaceae bacterium]
MFRELPLLDRFAAARAAGFGGVEIQRLAEGDPDEMARAAREAGVAVVLVNVGSGDYVAGGHGLSGVPGQEEAFRQSLEFALGAAEILGARQVHIGPSRVPMGVSREECRRTLEANVRLALSLSRANATTLLLEAMNRVEVPTALLPDVATAVACIDALAAPRVGLQFDVYHVAMNGEDALVEFGRHQRIVRHVQFSDMPGRHEPGTGTLDLPGILCGMREAGYTGWFGAEYHPVARTTEGLGWMKALCDGRDA